VKESIPADESRHGRGRDPMIDLNPQAAQMADESMVRTLAAQAQAIWPQEAPLLLRYRLPQEPAVLDAGCGTGEGASRLAELFGSARVLGVDIIDAHLDVARSRYARLAPRLSFSHQSLYALGAADEAFDLVACRHVLHSIPHTDRVLAELLRVTRRGGYVHIIAEDYGMIHFDEQSGVRDFWSVAPAAFGAATGTDLFVGRNIVPLLSQLDVDAITVDYAIVDTLRVPRETFGDMLAAWRDGFVDPIAELTPLSREATAAAFERMIATVRSPPGYAVWMVPIVSARRR
jgi:ubiquinone/menaquinone biosynthesis C-methylase UbiE